MREKKKLLKGEKEEGIFYGGVREEYKKGVKVLQCKGGEKKC